MAQAMIRVVVLGYVGRVGEEMVGRHDEITQRGRLVLGRRPLILPAERHRAQALGSLGLLIFVKVCCCCVRGCKSAGYSAFPQRGDNNKHVGK